MNPILAHTMATPDLQPTAALELAARLELAGIELVCQQDYRCGISPGASFHETSELARAAAQRGLVIAGLVPYSKALSAPKADDRKSAIAEFKQVIRLAADLGCLAVRVLAGSEAAGHEWTSSLHRLADSLRELAAFAEPLGIELNVENHMDTMAVSAARTMAIVAAAGRSNVGVLYDQANLMIMGAEDAEEALAAQFPAIRHVHVKDFRPNQEGEREPVVLGEGILPWPDIVSELARRGYAGYYSLEYEKRWFPDLLPPAELGLRIGRDRLRHMLERSKAATA